MKEIAKKETALSESFTMLMKEILRQVIYLALGFFFSKIALGANEYPYGVSFVASVFGRVLPSAYIGCAVGYILPLGKSSVKYIISATAAAIIKVVILRFADKDKVKAWSYSATSILLFLTGAITSGSNFPSMIRVVFESLAGGGITYALSTLLSVDKQQGPKGIRESVSLAVITTLIISGIYPISFSAITLGGVVSAILIIASSMFGGVGVGALVGGLCGIAGFISCGDMSIPLVLTFMGTVCGLVGKMGKLATASAGLLTAVTAVTFLGFPDGSITLLTSTLLGTVISVIIPSKWLVYTSAYLHLKNESRDSYLSIKRSLDTKLGFVADALLGIGDTVGEVSDRLSLSDAPDFSRVIASTAKEACDGCSFFLSCWEIERDETERSIKVLAGCLKSGRPISLAELNDSFSHRCPRKERVENALHKYYNRYSLSLDKDIRAREIRSALNEQYRGFSEMLRDIARDLDEDECYNDLFAHDFKTALSALGLDCRRVTCKLNKQGRFLLLAEIQSPIKRPVGRSRIRTAAEEICGRNFDVPEIVRARGVTLITLSEKRVFDLDHSIVKIKKGDNKVSGDTAEIFFDGCGKAYVVLSDGMGTGGRAAIDSAMVTNLFHKLICSGFGFGCALKFINTAMMYRSSEESTASLDIAVIDLYKGDVSLYKAGAAPTVIVRDGKVSKADCSSLPLGILNEVSFSKASLNMKAGDVLVMSSDGVSCGGVDIIGEAVNSADVLSASLISEDIARRAKEGRTDGHDDDITVVTVVLQKAI